MAQWWYRSMGSEVGPLSNPQLLELVRKGEINPETEIKKDDAKWVLAKTVGGLFEAAGTHGNEQVCPYCGKTVANPPAKCGGCKRWVSVAMKQSSGGKKKGFKDIAAGMQSAGEDYVDVEDKGNWMLIAFAVNVCLLFLSLIYCYISGTWSNFAFGMLLLFFALAMSCIGAYWWKNKDPEAG